MLDILLCPCCWRRKDPESIEGTERGRNPPEDSWEKVPNNSTQEQSRNANSSEAANASSAAPEMEEHEGAKRNRLKEAIRSRFPTHSGMSSRIRSREDSCYTIHDEGTAREEGSKHVLDKRMRRGCLRLEQLTSLDGYDSDAEVLPTPVVSQYQSQVRLDGSFDGTGSDVPVGSNAHPHHRPDPSHADTLGPMKGQSAVCYQTKRRKLPGKERKARSTSAFEPPFLSLPKNLGSPYVFDSAKTLTKHRSLQTNVPKRKPLPGFATGNTSSVESPTKHLISNPREITSDRRAFGSDFERNTCKDEPSKPSNLEGRSFLLRHCSSEQGSMENVPPLDAFSAVVVPPRPLSKPRSSSSQSETSKLHLRKASSGTYSGNSSFRYTGSFRPAVFLPKRDKPKSKKAQAPRKSNFREDFDIPKPRSMDNLDGTEERTSAPVPHSHRRRPHEPGIMPYGEEAADLWERALQTHARDISARQNKFYLGFSGTMWAASRRNVAASSPGQTSRARSRRLSMDSMEIAPDVVVPKPPARSAPVRERPEGTWARWPSHTRRARTESAGADDHVHSYDFAIKHELARTSSSIERNRRKHMPVPGSRNFLDIIKDRYVNERSDLLRMERGYRSSVSVGGVLRYPDLELLPKLEPDHLLPAYRRGSSNFSNHISSDESGIHPEDARRGSGPDTPLLPTSAGGWSQLYQDCVSKPPFSEAGEETEESPSDTSGLLSPTYVPRQRSKAPYLKATSSDSLLDVRRSTVDFHQSVRLKEMESRKSLFKAIEGMANGDRHEES